MKCREGHDLVQPSGFWETVRGQKMAAGLKSEQSPRGILEDRSRRVKGRCLEVHKPVVG
jgi:hypothetical protein